MNNLKKCIKKITLLVLLVTTIPLSVACSSSNDNVKAETSNGFVIVSTQNVDNGMSSGGKYLTIMYDPNTLVMYTITFGPNGDSYISPLTPLYNADGTLRTYTPNAESN